MSILNKLTIKNLKLNKRRTIVTIIGIILSVALICAVASMVSSFRESLIRFEINKDGNGVYFSKICHYQELSPDVLQTIVSNLKAPQRPIITDFLIDNIELVTDKKVLNNLYLTLVDKYGGAKYILRMPEEYQKKYVKSLDNPEKMIIFLNMTKFSKEKKMELLGNIF